MARASKVVGLVMGTDDRKCRVLGHRWKQMTARDGSTYKGCARCGISRAEHYYLGTRAQPGSKGAGDAQGGGEWGGGAGDGGGGNSI